jgi:hypothetical protein
VGKLIFLPMRLCAGLLSGIVGKKLFERLWAVIDGRRSATRTLVPIAPRQHFGGPCSEQSGRLLVGNRGRRRRL